MCGANTSESATEAVMKAVLALFIIYVGTFFLVIQGASQNPVQAAPQSATALQDNGARTPAKPLDPARDADIRSLMELLGVRDALQEADRKSTRLNSSHLVISYAVFCLKKKIDSNSFRLTYSF